MKKTLVALALPVMLLTACNKQPVDNNYIKYREFQQMARNTISDGIMEHGTFTVIVVAYNYNSETGQRGDRDYERSETYNFIVDGDLMYYKEGESSLEYILDLENNVTLRKNSSIWIDQHEDPVTTNGYRCFAAQIGSCSNQLVGDKHGKYNSNESLINYQFKLSSGYGYVTYHCMYDREAALLTFINRIYHDLNTEYDVEIRNISLDGEIPEHPVA